MVTNRELLARQAEAMRRNGSNVYGGPRLPQQAPPPPAPVPRRAGGEGSQFEAMLAARKKQREVQGARNEAQSQIAQVQGGSDGIGGIIGSGVGKVFGGAASALGFLGRGTVAALDTVAGTQVGSTMANMQGQNGLSSVLAGFDTTDNADDPRSFMDKVNDVEYGYGQAMKKSGNQWVDRPLGFLGDVTYDPLSYVTPGSGTVSSVQGRAALAGRASAQGMSEEVVAALGKYGPAMVDDASRAALDIGPSNLRFMGEAIPGTERLGASLSKGTARGREAIMGTRVGVWARGLRGDEVTKAARAVLTSGKASGSMTPGVAADVLRITDGIKGLGGQVHRSFTNKMETALRGTLERDGSKFLDELEAGGQQGTRQVMDEMHELMRAEGIDVGWIENQVPHRWTDDGRKWLNGTSEDAAATRMIMESATAAPGAVRTRVIKEGQSITLNGKAHELKKGTVKEINDLFEKELGFRPLIEDPRVLMSNYVSEVSRAVGINKALKDYFASGSPNVSTLEHVGKDVLTEFAATANGAVGKAAAAFIEAQEKSLLRLAEDAAKHADSARLSAIDSTRDVLEKINIEGYNATAAARGAKNRVRSASEELDALDKELKARLAAVRGQIDAAQTRINTVDEKLAAANLQTAVERQGPLDPKKVQARIDANIAPLNAERDAAVKAHAEAVEKAQKIEAAGRSLSERLELANSWQRYAADGDEGAAAYATSLRSPTPDPTLRPRKPKKMTNTPAGRRQAYIDKAKERVAGRDYDGAVESAGKALDEARAARAEADIKVNRARRKGPVAGTTPNMDPVLREYHQNQRRLFAERLAADETINDGDFAIFADWVVQEDAVKSLDEAEVEAAFEGMQDQFFKAIEAQVKAGDELERIAKALAASRALHQEMYERGMTSNQRVMINALEEQTDARIGELVAEQALDIARDAQRRGPMVDSRSIEDAKRAMDDIERVERHAEWYKSQGEEVSGELIPAKPVRTQRMLNDALKEVDTAIKGMPNEYIALEDLTKAIRLGAEVSEQEVRVAALHIDKLLTVRSEAISEVDKFSNRVKELRRELGLAGNGNLEGPLAPIGERARQRQATELHRQYTEGTISYQKYNEQLDKLNSMPSRDVNDVAARRAANQDATIGVNTNSTQHQARRDAQISKVEKQLDRGIITPTEYEQKLAMIDAESRIGDDVDLDPWAERFNEGRQLSPSQRFNEADGVDVDIVAYNEARANLKAAQEDLADVEGVLDSILKTEFGDKAMTIEKIAKLMPGYGKNVNKGFFIDGVAHTKAEVVDLVRQKYGDLDTLLEKNPQIPAPPGWTPPKGSSRKPGTGPAKNVSISSLKHSLLGEALGVEVVQREMGYGDRLKALSGWVSKQLSDMPMRGRARLHQSSIDGAQRHDAAIREVHEQLLAKKALLDAEKKEVKAAGSTIRGNVTAVPRNEQSLLRNQQLDAPAAQMDASTAELDALLASQAADVPYGQQVGDAVAQERASVVDPKVALDERRASLQATQDEKLSLYDQTLADAAPKQGELKQKKYEAEFDQAEADAKLKVLEDSFDDLTRRVAKMTSAKPKAPEAKVKVKEVQKSLDETKALIDAAREAGAEGLDLEVAALQMQRATDALAAMTKVEESIELAKNIGKVAGKGKWVVTELPDGTKVSPYWSKVITDGWTQVDARMYQGDGVMKDAVAQGLKNVIEFTSDAEAWKTIDALTQFFKTYATATPGFHARNAMSATFMNASDGVKLSEQKEGLKLWREMVNAPDSIKWLDAQPPEVQRAFQAVYASGAGGQYGATELGSGIRRVSKKASDNKVTRLSHRWGTDWVEGPVRLSLSLNEVRRGGDMYTAAARIARVHFDYSQVSKFDRVMKRIIPFWTFMSRNLPLQIQQMWTKPQAYAVYNNFVKNFDIGEDGEVAPQWLQDAGGFAAARNVPFLGGRDAFLRPDMPHKNLVADLAEFQDSPLSAAANANPFMRVPIELLANKGAFFGNEIYEGDFKWEGDQMKDAGRYALESFIPTIGQVQRVTGQGRAEGKQFEKILNYMGVPITGVGEQERANELRRRAYDQVG